MEKDATALVIKSMRTTIDVFINTAKQFPQKSREISLAHTELQRAKHLLGLCLKSLGTDNPYPNSSDSKNTIIDKQAEHDAEKTLFPTFEESGCTTYIAMVKEFRAIIQRLLDNGTYAIAITNTPDNYARESKLALEEAKCWLGWELDVIANKETVPPPHIATPIWDKLDTIENDHAAVKQVQTPRIDTVQNLINNLFSIEKSQLSDGYHTFEELYEFRLMYNAALFNEWHNQGKYDVHKSWKHHDGELCFGGGWFIVVALLPSGQISNHYEGHEWDLFSIPETETAKHPFDGHTAGDVIERILKIL